MGVYWVSCNRRGGSRQEILHGKRGCGLNVFLFGTLVLERLKVNGLLITDLLGEMLRIWLDLYAQ